MTMRSIDQYDIGQVIGIGAFAQVFRGRCRLSGDCVALKLIDKAKLREKGLVGRVQNEIRIHWQLKNDYILKMNDFFEDEYFVYFSLELCDYGDLYHHMKANGTLSDVYVKTIGYQVAKAVCYLHDAGIVHRDIKLSNILLCHSPSLPLNITCHCKAITVVKLCDFGLATRLNFPTDETYTYCGTPYYLAPEVGDSNGHGFPSDIWSYGCMLKLLLSSSSSSSSSITDPLLTQDPSQRPTASQLCQLDYFRHSCVRPFKCFSHAFNFELWKLPTISHTSKDYQISIQTRNGVTVFLVILLRNSLPVICGFIVSRRERILCIINRNSNSSMKDDDIVNSALCSDDDCIETEFESGDDAHLLSGIVYQIYNKLMQRVPSAILYLHHSNDLVELKLSVMSNKPIPVLSGRFYDGGRILYDPHSYSIQFNSPKHPEYIYKRRRSAKSSEAGVYSSFSSCHHPDHVAHHLTKLLDTYDILLKKKSLAMSTDGFPEVFHQYTEEMRSSSSQLLPQSFSPSSIVLRQNNLSLSEDGSFVSFTTSDGSIVRLEPASKLVWVKQSRQSSSSSTNQVVGDDDPWEKFDIGQSRDVSRMPRNLKTSLRSALHFLKSS